MIIYSSTLILQKIFMSLPDPIYHEITLKTESEARIEMILTWQQDLLFQKTPNSSTRCYGTRVMTFAKLEHNYLLTVQKQPNTTQLHDYL